MQSKPLPKILIIDTGYLSSNNATGITLRSIWEKWPDDNIMSICVNPNQRIENERYLNRIHVVERKYIVGAQISWYSKRLMNGLQNEPAVNNNSLSNKKSRKGSLIEFAKGIIDSAPIIIDKKTKHKIIEFNPDVIYTLGGSIRVFKYALKVSQLIDRNILVHFMDAYLDVQYKVYRSTHIFNKILMKYLKKCMKRSSAILCISQKMAIEYHHVFNLPTYTAMNCDCVRNDQQYINENPLHLVYAGGLHLGRWQTINELCKAIDKMNSETTRIVLDMYIPKTEVSDKQEMVKEYRGTYVHPAKSHNEILEIYKSSDLLVFVESFDTHIRKYTRLSFSTKLPEYMASAKPIICFAPEDLATSQYISEHNIGICIGENDDLIDCLDKVLFNYDLRKKMSNNAIKRFEIDFSPMQVEKNIMEALETSIKS